MQSLSGSVMRCVVYLRSPNSRQTQDPEPVEWDSNKEQKLWAILQSEKFNWNDLARQFNVSKLYILQQAAWLYEKELRLLKTRMNHIALPKEQPQAVQPERRLISMSRIESSESESGSEDAFVL